MNRWWYKTVSTCTEEKWDLLQWKPLFFAAHLEKIKAKEGKVERDDAAGPTSNV